MIPDPNDRAGYIPIKLGKIALLDADYVKYVITSRIFKRYDKTGDKKPVDFFLQPWIDEWHEKISDPIIWCFSAKSYQTFRYNIAFEKEYKGSRALVEDKQDYPGKKEDAYACVDYIQKRYIALLFDDLEADDILAALHDKDSYIITNDKDLKQSPGTHYDISTHKIFEISKSEAFNFLCAQMLTGDRTDDIVGIDGIGPKNAERILKGLKPQEMMHQVLHEYQKRYGLFDGTDMFVETWNLVKMRGNRGTWFKSKYERMFETKKTLLDAIRK